MTKSVGVHEAKTHLSQLLEEVSAGEEITITNRGRRVAKIVPIRAKVPNFGFARGDIWIADDFDAPLPEDLLELFER